MALGAKSAILILAILLVLLPSQVHAFGAGSMFLSVLFYATSDVKPGLVARKNPISHHAYYS